jgi:hypothetical protein
LIGVPSFIFTQNESSPSVGAITRAQMRNVPAASTVNR